MKYRNELKQLDNFVQYNQFIYTYTLPLLERTRYNQNTVVSMLPTKPINLNGRYDLISG
jgi:hypothetical protein